MDKRRVVLRFPRDIVEKPIINRLAKEYEITFSILKAAITPKEEGVMLLQLEGKDRELDKGIDYIKSSGAEIEEMEKDIRMNDQKCTDCGACLTACPTDALVREPETCEVIFDSSKCIACELCVPRCPYHAMEVHF